MRLRFLLPMTLVCALSLTACHRNTSSDEAVQLHRFEKVLFDTPVDQLQGKLMSVAGEYNTELLNLQPQNPEFVEMVKGFVQDPTVRDIYHLVDSVFGDMQPQHKALSQALAKAHQLYDTIHYDKVFTFLQCQFNYDMRVGCNSHELIVSIDQYILPFAQKYNYFNTPLYLVKQSRPEYLVADCMTAVARQYIAIPQQGDLTMLDYMIAEGKAIYFAQQTLPKTHDSILMRYTTPQLEWMEQNEEHVWSYFLQERMLYSVDYNQFHNFVDDAPQTNAIPGSSPRMTDYIGWHIVSQYAKETGCSMKELFEETDAQKILSKSKYRPK